MLRMTSFVAASFIVAFGGTARADDYKLIDQEEINCEIRDFYYNGVVASDGVKPIGGEIGEFSCNGKVLQLTMKKFDDGFVVTKDYGKIMIRFDSSLYGTTFAVLMTDMQRDAIKDLGQN